MWNVESDKNESVNFLLIMIIIEDDDTILFFFLSFLAT